MSSTVWHKRFAVTPFLVPLCVVFLFALAAFEFLWSLLHQSIDSVASFWSLRSLISGVFRVTLSGFALDLSLQFWGTWTPSTAWVCLSPRLNVFAQPQLIRAFISPTLSFVRGSYASGSLSFFDLWVCTIHKVWEIHLGYCGSVDRVLACEPKGHWFDSQSGHMPGL